jgi:hypothetical protein
MLNGRKTEEAPIQAMIKCMKIAFTFLILVMSAICSAEQAGVRQYIRIDMVDYSDGSHPESCPGDIDLRPAESDGNGMTLKRKVLTDYGNDPDNWLAAHSSPGE